MFALSLLVLGVLWVVTLIGILGLASNGRFSFAGGGYAMPVLAHIVWGFAALAVATELANVPALLRLTLALTPVGIHLAWMFSSTVAQPLLLVTLGAQFLVPVGLAMAPLLHADGAGQREGRGDSSDSRERQRSL